MTKPLDANHQRQQVHDPIPTHWSGEQALLVCDLLMALHDAICDRYQRHMLEAIGEPLPGADSLYDDDLPF